MLLCRDRTMLRIAGGALTMFGTWEWRERHGSAPCVIASEAKQSSFLRRPTRKLDCFVASLLAMTAGHTFSFPQLVFARVAQFRRPSPVRGRRESRAPTAPAVPCAKACYRNAHGLTTGTAETSRLSPRNGFTAYTGSPRGSGLSCPRCRREGSRQRSARVAAPGPHDFAVRYRRFRPASFV
jgi:hypothetical protein